jgi:hypothetical protein
MSSSSVARICSVCRNAVLFAGPATLAMSVFCSQPTCSRNDVVLFLFTMLVTNPLQPCGEAYVVLVAAPSVEVRGERGKGSCVFTHKNGGCVWLRSRCKVALTFTCLRYHDGGKDQRSCRLSKTLYSPPRCDGWRVVFFLRRRYACHPPSRIVVMWSVCTQNRTECD